MAKNKIPEKKYYDVKVEAMIPAVLVYKVLAETPEEAAELIKNKQPNSVQHKLAGRKESKATVYESGSSVIRFIKRMLGR